MLPSKASDYFIFLHHLTLAPELHVCVGGPGTYMWGEIRFRFTLCHCVTLAGFGVDIHPSAPKLERTEKPVIITA